MGRQRRQDNSLDSRLGQRNRQPRNAQGSNDDIVTISVRYNGIEQTIIERRRSIERVEDPHSPGVMIPYTVNDMVYSTDDNSNPLGTTRRAGGCSFGHIVDRKTLSVCAICHSNICTRHTFTVGRMAFCRGRFCLVLGAMAWLFSWAFRLVAFCFMSVLGLRGDGEPDVPEEAPPVPDNRIRREVNQIPRIRRE